MLANSANSRTLSRLMSAYSEHTVGPFSAYLQPILSRSEPNIPVPGGTPEFFTGRHLLQLRPRLKIVKVIKAQPQNLPGKFFRQRWKRRRCRDAAPRRPIQRHVARRRAHRHVTHFAVLLDHKLN